MVKTSRPPTRKAAPRGVAKAPRVSGKVLASLSLNRPATGPSTKAVEANLSILQKHLGHHCPHFGKKGVVQLAAPVTSAASSSRSTSASAAAGGLPRFNKYAGWVEWRNAIFVWMNASGGSFTNTFRRGGSQVNWYVGGANPTEKSPIVKRLLSIANRDDAKESKTRIMLFCRRLATEPYVYCGNVKYLRHDAKKKGFEFTWQLRDVEKLKAQPGFKRILTCSAIGKKGSAEANAAAAAKWA
eukprot:TRINITY_DN111768_c0_g1_i1.p1 TRINITY_DN111768_c0_g1~~TRINITY_DN111768_c0_g1_i1.p1  ORF type:complete len:242 (-),score=35.34 TRINITY_DN111768_c0_g1_i1:210-935(-)